MQFTVTKFGTCAAQIKVLIGRAASFGMAASCISALKQVQDHLQKHPLEWGDPDFNLKVGSGVVCHGIESPFIVRYAVYPEHKLVCIIDIRPMPGSSLDNP